MEQLNGFTFLPQLIQVIGVTKPTLYRWWADPNNDFPRPRKIGMRRIGVPTAELNKWLANRPQARIGGAA